MSRPVPDRARHLAAELELRFAQDAELAKRLNESHERLRRANDPLWWGLHPDGMATLYGEHPAAADVAVEENRSEVLGAPEPLVEAHKVHSQIHRAHCDYQRAAEDRRCLAANIGEVVRAFVDELAAAGWPESEARNANLHELARSEEEV